MNKLRYILRDVELVSALEFDLIHYCNGLQLRDMWRRDSGVTVRQVANLCWQLPREARVNQLIGGDKVRWGEQEYLLLSCVNLLRTSAYLLGPCASYAMGEKSSELKSNMPEPLYPPGHEEPKPEMTDMKVVMGMFGVGKKGARLKG